MPRRTKKAKSKSRMVSFRLSEEEYLQFREACSVHGVRSLSELARVAMQKMASHPKTTIDLQIQQLRDRVLSLSAELEGLANQVRVGSARGASCE